SVNIESKPPRCLSLYSSRHRSTLAGHLPRTRRCAMMEGPGTLAPAGRAPPVESRTNMARIIWGIAAALVAIWVFFAVVRAVGALLHLALVVAIILIAYNLLSGL